MLGTARKALMRSSRARAQSPSFLQQGSARGHHTTQRIRNRGISVVVMATSVDAARPFTRTAPADSCVSVRGGGLATLWLSLSTQLQWLPDSRCVGPTEAEVVGGQSGTEGMPVCALVLTGRITPTAFTTAVYWKPGYQALFRSWHACMHCGLNFREE